MIAAQLFHQSVLSGGLDTFGEGFEIQPPGHGQDGADEFLLSWILIHSGHEGTVDFDTRYVETFDGRISLLPVRF